jgi:hypothetical protein
MKKLWIALLLAILVSNSITDVLADSLTTKVTGHIRADFFSLHTTEKVWRARPHNPVCTITNNGYTVCDPAPLQDLTQCKLTFDGQLVCVDVCGGLSVPATICTYE